MNYKVLLGIMSGSFVSILSGIPRSIYGWIIGKISVSVEFDGSDDSHRWLISWIACQPKIHISLHRVLSCGHRTFYLRPSFGRYLTYYAGRPMLITFAKGGSSGKSTMLDDSNICVTMLFGSKEKLMQLVTDAVNISVPENEKVYIYVPNGHFASPCWSQVHAALPRRIDSVVLGGDQANQILQDMRHFRESYEYYAERGIPWRRGYLLHGPPGNGKTSTIMAIAGADGASIYILHLTGPYLSDESLPLLLAMVPSNAMLVVEDVDCVFPDRNTLLERESNGKNDEKVVRRLSFSGFLNAIDGLSAAEGRVVFMTTNHIDKLDKALVRPGRVDRMFLFGDSTRDQRMRLAAKFYPSSSQEELARFADLFQGSPSMAAVQEVLLESTKLPVALEEV